MSYEPKEYPLDYVESLNDARTAPTELFSILF